MKWELTRFYTVFALIRPLTLALSDFALQKILNLVTAVLIKIDGNKLLPPAVMYSHTLQPWALLASSSSAVNPTSFPGLSSSRPLKRDPGNEVTSSCSAPSLPLSLVRLDLNPLGLGLRLRTERGYLPAQNLDVYKLFCCCCCCCCWGFFFGFVLSFLIFKANIHQHLASPNIYQNNSVWQVVVHGQYLMFRICCFNENLIVVTFTPDHLTLALFCFVLFFFLLLFFWGGAVVLFGQVWWLRRFGK